MTKIYELLNSKYVMDLDEQMPLKKVGCHWENELDNGVIAYVDDFYKFSDNYSVTTKEIYDQYAEECREERYVMVELLWKDWKEILQGVDLENESARKLYRELM